jgi:TfoX/Sxy family transcriptional regulator of competence genes
MFGGIAAKVNGHMFAGLFGRSAIVLLSDADRTAALALDGAALFDPMGNGRVMSDKVMLPEDVFHEPAELRQWIARAFEVAATLPRKTKAGGKQPTVAKKAAAKSAVAKKAAAKPAAAARKAR